MKSHYLLGEVAKLLNRKPHQIVHLLTTGQIPEPATRIGNRRLFTENVVTLLAGHFRVVPDWTVVEAAPSTADEKSKERLTLRPPFEVIPSGEAGLAVRDREGEVFAWAGDRGHALVVAGLLELAAGG
jgi:hypothetical protein